MKFAKKVKKLILEHWKGFSISVILLLFLFSYIWFAMIKGIFPAGDNLQKGDWLSFWGSFLSFAGSLILGIIAVWQNNRANELNERAILENKRINELQSEWNKKAILENRKISEIQFEHELKRNEYTLIINGIQAISSRIYNIVQSTAEITTKEVDKSILKDYIESIILDVHLLQHAEMNALLPAFYEEKYAELKSGKERISEALNGFNVALKDAVTALEKNDKNPHVLLQYPNETLVQLSSLFYEKLNSIQSYRSFVEEEISNGH